MKTMKLPQIGETWQHFKGGLYRIHDFSWGADGDDLVLRIHYVKDKGHEGPPYSRTIVNFVGSVDTRAPARFVCVKA